MNEYWLLAFSIVLFWRSDTLISRVVTMQAIPDVTWVENHLERMNSHGTLCCILGYIAFFTSLVIWYRG